MIPFTPDSLGFMSLKVDSNLEVRQFFYRVWANKSKWYSYSFLNLDPRLINVRKIVGSYPTTNANRLVGPAALAYCSGVGSANGAFEAM